MREYIYRAEPIGEELYTYTLAGELVRCGECKYASPNSVYGCRLERFSAHDQSERMFTNDFCSRGEKESRR